MVGSVILIKGDLSYRHKNGDIKMSITKNCKKEKNFISYYQSVTTVGIVSKAKNIKEAEEKAKQKVVNFGFVCGLVSQTPMELSGTEEWKEKQK